MMCYILYIDEDSNNPATAAPTEAPGPEVCFDVTTNANIWAHEIQWNIGGSTHDSCENEKSNFKFQNTGLSDDSI